MLTFWVNLFPKGRVVFKGRENEKLGLLKDQTGQKREKSEVQSLSILSQNHRHLIEIV
jgi:hypothetical protein